MSLTLSLLAQANSPEIPWLVILTMLGGLSLFLIQTGLGKAENRMLWIGMGILLLLSPLIVFGTNQPLTMPHALLTGFGILSVIGACGLVSFRQPVHAALGFALSMLAGAGIFMLQGAPFIAASTTIIYSGATIIIFLFVLMFAQSRTLKIQDVRVTAPRMSILAGSILLWLMLDAINSVPLIETTGHPETVSHPAPKVVDLGRVMYSDYLYAVEIAGTLLLVATIGAIIIGQKIIGQKQITSIMPANTSSSDVKHLLNSKGVTG